VFKAGAVGARARATVADELSLASTLIDHRASAREYCR
jgi:hypothetical protein